MNPNDDIEQWSDRLTQMGMEELRRIDELEKQLPQQDDVLSHYGLTEEFFLTPMTPEKLHFLVSLSQNILVR
ncbi:hypothetical protein FACS189427_13800 [Planctomycetales bacterium]|nr:hypothetical protein FACS189427_13800 [Planctomycetales bacterium]